MKNYKSPYSIPVLKRNMNGVEELCFIYEDKSNCLNNLFVSVSSIDSYKTVLPQDFSSLENIRIERSDIEDFIATLDVNKAVDHDLMFLTMTFVTMLITSSSIVIVTETNAYSCFEKPATYIL